VAVDDRHKGKMNADQIPTLPALRTLGNLADVRPTIITDTREQTPLRFTNLVTVLGTLTSGDYAPRGLEHIAAIERKSAADLVSSVTHDRDRFERELHRLRGMHFARVIVTSSRDVIAAGAYRSNANPRAVLASCDTFEVRYGVPFVFVEDDTAAALLVERWVWLVCREIVSQANDLARGTGVVR
jgi:DNA excision repair protein ERCC-4